MYPANTTSGFLCSSLCDDTRYIHRQCEEQRAPRVSRRRTRANPRHRAASQSKFKVFTRTFEASCPWCDPRAEARTSRRFLLWYRARMRVFVRHPAARIGRRGSVGSYRVCANERRAVAQRCTREVVTLTRDRMANDDASMTAAAGDISIGALIDDLKVRARAWRRDSRMRVAQSAFDRLSIDRSFDRCRTF